MTTKDAIQGVEPKLNEDGYGDKVYKEKYILIVLFILALTIRIAVFIQNGNHAADGMYRTILTMNWLKDPYFITSGLWPPLDLYLMAMTTYIFNDPIVSTRLVSLILGTIIIFPYYYLVKLLFDKKIATISTLVLAFTSIYIQYSTYSMSEVPLTFFLVVSLYFFFRFKKGEKKLTDLILSAIFIDLASMTRYEAWLFIPLLTIFILDIKNIKDISLKNILKNDIRYIFIFLIISSIFPIFWMIGNYNSYGDPLYGQTWSDKWIKINTVLNPDSQWLNPPFYKKLTAWPGSILYVLNIVSIFAGIGLLISLWRRKNLEFLSIFLILMGIFTYKLINVTMMPQPRHIIMPILFLIPYFMTGLDIVLDIVYGYMVSIIKPINKNWRRHVTMIVICIFIVLSSYTAIAKNPYVTPDYVMNVSEWIKINVKSNETILLDEYNWWGLHILFFSGFNTTFTEDYLKTFEYNTDQIRIVPAGGKKVDEKTIINYLENNPTYLVYSPKGKLSRILNFSSKCQDEKYHDYLFECEYSTENYNIYKLHT